MKIIITDSIPKLMWNVKKIKVLRMMDVSTVDIKAIAFNEIALSKVMEKRLKEIRDEQKN